MPYLEKPSPKEPGAARDLLHLLWRQPLWAIPFALFFGVLFGHRWSDYVLCYKMSLIFAYFIGFSIWAVSHFVVPRTCGSNLGATPQSRVHASLWHMAGALVAAYVASFVINFTVLPGLMGSPRSLLISGMFTLLFAALFTGINSAIVFYRQALDRARAMEQIRAELAEAELRALRAQINPHFLFNTLNSIASLIGSDPAAAEETTTRLAEVFRYALRASERGQARLADELDFVRSYLEIERTRFRDRLTVEEAIEPGLDSTLVPSLLLQPLVENAVHHAIAPRPEGGTLRIAARREAGGLAIEVADDGPGFDGASPDRGGGFGLHSVRERLRALGLADALRIDSPPGGGASVRILLPLADPTPGDPNPRPQGDRP